MRRLITNLLTSTFQAEYERRLVAQYAVTRRLWSEVESDDDYLDDDDDDDYLPSSNYSSQIVEF